MHDCPRRSREESEKAMFQSDSARERAKLIDERLAKLRAQKDRLLSRASRAERRRDTRQKIVIGGTVLAALGHRRRAPAAVPGGPAAVAGRATDPARRP